MKNKRLVPTLLFSTIALLFSSIIVSFAWFSSSTRNDAGQAIKGTILAKYFHCGTGTQDDPFIITTPKHFENLVWLHNNVENFWKATDENVTVKDHGFYFEIGCSEARLNSPNDKDNEGPNTYANEDPNATKYVYHFTNTGYSNGTTSTTLNLAGLKNDFIPIGSVNQPFIGSLNGNGITVSNFVVNSAYKASGSTTTTKLSDVGIFGYVGENGTCNNVYFNNFQIDIDSGTYADGLDIGHVGDIDDSGNVILHESHKDDDSETSYVGYLCGHLFKATNFTNVYVNRCSMKGSSTSYDQKDTYGYYGYIEEDYTEGSTGHGNSYSFSLDSSAVYQYLASRTSSDATTNIYSQRMVTRNTEYKDYINTNEGKRNLSAAFENTNGFITGNNYSLLGDTPEEDSAPVNNGGSGFGDYNYSLSTLGYNGNQYLTNLYDYEVRYLNSNSTNLNSLTEANWKNYTSVMPVDVTQTTQSFTDVSNSLFGSGSYLGRTDGKFSYFYIQNDAKTTLSVNVNSGKSGNKAQTITATNSRYSVGSVWNYNPDSNSYATLHVFVDDFAEQTYTLQKGTSTSDKKEFYNDIQTTSNGRYKTFYSYFTFDKTFSFTVPRGTHYVCAYLEVQYNHSCDYLMEHYYYNTNSSSLSSSKNGLGRYKSGSFSQIAVTVPQSGLSLSSSLTTDFQIDPQYSGVSDVSKPSQKSGTTTASRTEGGSGFTEAKYLVGKIKEPTYIQDNAITNAATFASEKKKYEVIYQTSTSNPGVYTVATAYSSDSSIRYYYRSKTDTVRFTYLPDTSKGSTYDSYTFTNNNSELVDYYVKDESIINATTFNNSKTLHGTIYIKSGDNYNSINSYSSSYTEYYIKVRDDLVWNAQSKTSTPLNSGNQYIAGNDGETKENYAQHGNQIVNSGYSYKNIDIVGGGIKFSSDYITFKGDDNERALVYNMSHNYYRYDKNTKSYSSEAGVGTNFYATKYCANSIVLYLQNVGGSGESDEMGSISFNYTWSITGLVGATAKEPGFKKGEILNSSDGEHYVRFDDVGASTTGSWDRTVSMTLTRENVKKAAYCALDKDGKILCGYDKNGNSYDYVETSGGTQSYHPITIKPYQIDRYVLVVGVDNKIDGVNTRLTRIDFSYVAPDGFGGTFGSVGYRDSPETIEDTIFNFYFTSPTSASNSYFVYAYFDNTAITSGDHAGKRTYHLYFYTTYATTINIYLYDTTNYIVVLHYYNGTQVVTSNFTTSSGTMDVSAYPKANWGVSHAPRSGEAPF